MKRQYIFVAIICFCIIIIALVGFLYCKKNNKTDYERDINDYTNNEFKNEVESINTDYNNELNININNMQENENNIGTVISENNNTETKKYESNNNSQIVVSKNNDNSSSKTNTSIKNGNTEVSNKSNNSNISGNTSTTNVGNTLIDKTVDNNSNSLDTETKVQTNEGSNVVTKPKESEESNQKTESKKPEVQLNLAKYDRYQKALNGSYSCFKRNATEIEKLRKLINQAIKDFGYTDVQIKEDSSIINNRYFTANKTNVENLVYNSDGFKIYYYAETEYSLSADGQETVFQVRSYIKVK